MAETNYTTNNIDKMLTKLGSTSDAVDVVVQSTTSSLFQYILMNEQKTDITLTSIITTDDMVVNVSAGHGFTGVAGEFMVVRNGNVFFQLRVKSVATNAITVESPIDNDYPITSSVMRGNVNMNVNGASIPVDFKYSFNGTEEATVPIDIQSVVFTFQSGNNVPDDGTFGGIGALVNGLLFRKVNGDNTGLGNYTSNQEFRDVGGEILYTQKAPSGTYATNILIDILGKFGQVIRLDPRELDYIFARVRDNLGTLDKFTISILGSFTSGE